MTPNDIKYPPITLVDILDNYRDLHQADYLRSDAVANNYCMIVRLNAVIYFEGEKYSSNSGYKLKGKLSLIDDEDYQLNYAAQYLRLNSHELLSILSEVAEHLRDPNTSIALQIRPSICLAVSVESDDEFPYLIKIHSPLPAEQLMHLVMHTEDIKDALDLHGVAGQAITVDFEYMINTDDMTAVPTPRPTASDTNPLADKIRENIRTGMLSSLVQPSPDDMEGTPVSMGKPENPKFIQKSRIMNDQYAGRSILDQMYTEIEAHMGADGGIPESVGLDEMPQEALELDALRNKQTMDRSVEEMKATMARMAAEDQQQAEREQSQEEQDAADAFFDEPLADDDPLKPDQT